MKGSVNRPLQPQPQGLGTGLNFVGIFITVAILAISMMGLSPSVTISGFNVQILEIAQALPLFWVLLVLPRIYRSEVAKGIAVVLVLNLVPLTYGLYSYGISSALRDFSGVYYMLMIIFGYAIGRFAVITGANLIVGLSIAGFIFVTGYSFQIAGGVLDYATLEYNYRIPALVCTSAAALCLVNFSRITGWRRGVVLAGGLLYAAFLLQLRTRAAYLGLAAGVSTILIQAGIVYLRDPRTLRQVANRLVLGVIAVLLVSVIYSEWIPLVFTNAQERTNVLLSGMYYTDETVAFRLEAWRLAWEEFLASPIFGVGFGKYMVLDPWLRHEYALYPSHMMHNGLLQILYSGGLLAMGANIYFWRCVYRIFKASSRFNAVIPILSLAISFLVYTAFGAILFKSVEAIPLWLILGLAIGEAERLMRVSIQGRPVSNRANAKTRRT
jgi:O-antigen ligase